MWGRSYIYDGGALALATIFIQGQDTKFYVALCIAPPLNYIFTEINKNLDCKIFHGKNPKFHLHAFMWCCWLVFCFFLVATTNKNIVDRD